MRGALSFWAVWQTACSKTLYAELYRELRYSVNISIEDFNKEITPWTQHRFTPSRKSPRNFKLRCVKSNYFVAI